MIQNAFNSFCSFLASDFSYSIGLLGMLIVFTKGYSYYANIQLHIKLAKAKELIRIQENNAMAMEDIIGHVELYQSVDMKCKFLMGRVRLIDSRIDNLAVASNDVSEYVGEFCNDSRVCSVEQRVNALEESIALIADKINNLEVLCTKTNELVISAPVRFRFSKDGYAVYNPSTGEITSGPFRIPPSDRFMDTYEHLQSSILARANADGISTGVTLTETHSNASLACQLENILCDPCLFYFGFLVLYVSIVMTVIFVVIKHRK